MRFLHLIRPVMCVLPEVAQPDRKVSAALLSRIVIAHCAVRDSAHRLDAISVQRTKCVCIIRVKSLPSRVSGSNQREALSWMPLDSLRFP